VDAGQLAVVGLDGADLAQWFFVGFAGKDHPDAIGHDMDGAVGRLSCGFLGRALLRHTATPMSRRASRPSSVRRALGQMGSQTTSMSTCVMPGITRRRCRMSDSIISVAGQPMAV